jgi:hypothetical protein
MGRQHDDQYYQSFDHRAVLWQGFLMTAAHAPVDQEHYPD